jgi:hypothetical protein
MLARAHGSDTVTSAAAMVGRAAQKAANAMFLTMKILSIE